MNAVKSRAAAESALREGKPSTSSLLPVETVGPVGTVETVGIVGPVALVLLF